MPTTRKSKQVRACCGKKGACIPVITLPYGNRTRQRAGINRSVRSKAKAA